jgi:type VI secretion system protein ImpL
VRLPAIDVLTSRWLVSFAGAVTVASLIWLFGPLLAPFESWLVRLGLVLAVLLSWGAISYATDLRRRQNDKALTDGLAADGDASAAADEVAALRARLTAALQSVNRTHASRGYLHERPWYVIIGPPGAGKTTALLNAGLRFPLVSELGTDPVKGVGGTRYCDWWFAEDAVLIDTAGRYTTRDSAPVADRAGWDAFLALLKQTRPGQPLNGAIVAIALNEIALAPADERMAHARAIRRRVRELQTQLGVRLPIYVLFTKADLIAGFSEFFADLDGTQRAQVWGTTFDPGADESNFIDTFARDFRVLVERLGARLFERLRAERNVNRRALIAMFPSQVASLEAPLVEFLKAALGGYPVKFVPLVRGVYLSSATQEGTPFDRLAGVLARAFGLDQRQAATLRPEQGRSYFLERLLREVIFGEAMLVSDTPAVERRRTLLHASGLAAAGLIIVTSGAWLSYLRATGVRQVDTSETAVTAYGQAAQMLPLDPVSDADLPRVLPLLDDALAVSLGLEDDAKQTGSWLNLGLSQGEKLTAGARVMYRHALERVLLPRLMWQLETQIRDNLDSPDFLYEATRIYLMLGNAGPLDRPLVHEWMRLAWQNIYPGAAFRAAREQLLRHLDTLLTEPLPPVSLDGDLVTRARGTFGKVSLSQRAYSRIRLSVAAQRITPWRPSDSLGAAGVALFNRMSGKPLTDGIPGLYTIDGFHHVLLPSLAKAAEDAASESWVIGQRTDIDPKSPEMGVLERSVIGLYEADYKQAWDNMVADLNIAPLTSISRAAQDLYILESPQSPMRALLVSMARQLTLSVPPGSVPPGSASPGQSPGSQAGTSTASAQETETVGGRLQALLGTAPSSAPRIWSPGQEIDLRYAALRELAGTGQAAPIDLVLRSLNDMQQQFAKAAAAGAGSNVLSAGSDPALALKVEALRQPQPLERWLTTLANSGSALRGGEQKH